MFIKTKLLKRMIAGNNYTFPCQNKTDTNNITISYNRYTLPFEYFHFPLYSKPILSHLSSIQPKNNVTSVSVEGVCFSIALKFISRRTLSWHFKAKPLSASVIPARWAGQARNRSVTGRPKATFLKPFGSYQGTRRIFPMRIPNRDAPWGIAWPEMGWHRLESEFHPRRTLI